MRYTPSNWFWIVGGSTTLAYSSKSASYIVQSTNAAYKAFLVSGKKATRIDTEANLEAVLAEQYPAGWTSTSSASASSPIA